MFTVLQHVHAVDEDMLDADGVLMRFLERGPIMGYTCLAPLSVPFLDHSPRFDSTRVWLVLLCNKKSLGNQNEGE